MMEDKAMMQDKSTMEDKAAKSALGGRMQAARRKFRRGRADESGLTTLEWLLIVAAVAGLAALAVVLVQNVVDETAEQISGSSARGQAAGRSTDPSSTKPRRYRRRQRRPRKQVPGTEGLDAVFQRKCNDSPSRTPTPRSK